MNKALKASVLFSLLSLTSCASIVSKSNWPVTISSDPTGAKVTIKKMDGTTAHEGITPFTVTLPSDAGFLDRANYRVEFVKEGYESSEQLMAAKINGWYFGNIVFGGIIGFLIVDPATGAMWKLNDTFVVSLPELPKQPALEAITANVSASEPTKD